MKKLIALLIAAMMIVSLIPVMAVSTSAAVEGLWDTYQGAGSYPDPDDEPDTVYVPESGYEYTSEGFSIVQPNWGKDVAPFVTVSTKEPQPIKEGIYIKFRVDAYSYGGDIGSDHWIAITVNTGKVENGLDDDFAEGAVSGKVQPGNTGYGGGWLTLLRGVGDGNVTSIAHLTDPKTETFGGSFLPEGAGVAAPAELDAEGREIHTFEITWDGSQYDIKLNGVSHPNMAGATALLERLSSTGDFFIGITMMDGYKGGDGCDLTILEYGTSAADATKPVGDDSKAPESNEVVIADIADPSTIEANMPAILWSPETYNLQTGNNVNFTPKGDNTWAASATEALVFFNLSPKRSWSYDATDFPVFGIMLRNIWVDTGTLWYAAGEYSGATDGLTVPFSVYDGQFYGEDQEYVFVPCDLEGLWEGRINSIRLDMNIEDETSREFDLCFAGMFRSEAEGYAYAEAWLAANGVTTPDEPGDDPADTGDETTEDTQAGNVEDTTAAGNTEDTTVAGNDNETVADGATTAPADETTAEAEKKGCGAVVGFGAVAVLAAAAAAVALKKKD